LKAPAFEYVKPASLEEAFGCLEHPNAKILAGGQSLIPTLNMRLSSPERLVDIGGLDELKKIEVKGAVLRIGALVTHAQLEKSSSVAKHVPLLAQAVPHVAHAAIRNRGTIGGSLALADPAAEYPAVAVALEAVLIVQGRKSERRVEAAKFFKGLFETDLQEGELLVAVEFPFAKASDKSAFLELARRHGDYAIVGLAAHNERFVYLGMGLKPELVKSAGSVEKTKAAMQSQLKPPADLYNSAATKLHLAGVLMERAWKTLST
jgi:carbon-monoxide dehydrogenase medium subunit